MKNDQLIESFRKAGQGHVFAFWDELKGKQREELLSQAAEVDLDEIARLHRTLVVEKKTAAGGFDDLEPAKYEKRPEHGGRADAWEKARNAGEEALRAGRVAAFTVAGGQGTRLGYDGPKGTFAVTPVRKKPLFQVFAEKLKAAGDRYGRPLHWFVMTSHANHAATEEFFKENKFYGLDPKRVHFFRQGRMPAISFDGKILMESKSSLALSPDGHGGSLRALERSGALALMRKEGIDALSYFQVDNPLVRAIDPEFIGFHFLTGSEMSSKMVPKAYAEEKLGHFCERDGRLVVVEYSDLPMEMQKQTLPDGSLRFNAGSIAIHVIDREFAARMAGSAPGGDAAGAAPELPFHRADKKIATIDAAGNPVKPDKPNGVKFELFVFDALPFARNPLVIETRREDDFSPVKNAEGVDSPQTSRDDQMKQVARWLKAAGVAVPMEKSGVPTFKMEVAPSFAVDEQSFVERWKALEKKPAITDGLYLE
jgi:UDP-N-acetylglucosamine/UDP-N-acetylgalactosamine diphosphorylase